MGEHRDNERWVNFGKWVADRRKQAGKTQSAAAAAADMNCAHWARIEIGTDEIKYSTIPRIARALGVDNAEAYREAGFAPPTIAIPLDQRKIDFTALIAGLPASDQEELEQLLTMKWYRANQTVEIPRLDPESQTHHASDLTSLLPYNYLTIDLRAAAILVGGDPPQHSMATHISSEFLRDLITRLVLLQSNSVVRDADFTEVMAAFSNNNIYTVKPKIHL